MATEDTFRMVAISTLGRDEVQVRVPCTACGGDGIVIAPEWEELRKRLLSVYLTSRDRPEFYRLNPLPKGPKEISCSECDGTGFQHRWIPLS